MWGIAKVTPFWAFCLFFNGIDQLLPIQIMSASTYSVCVCVCVCVRVLQLFWGCWNQYIVDGESITVM